MNDELAFNSKIDMWLLILLLTGVAACLWGVARIWDAGSVLLWPIAILLAIGVAVPIWILVSLKYFLSDRALRVRCGPFKWLIEIDDIESITPTNETRSSPAMSLDRLKIEYGDGRELMISPEPRQEFLRQLEHRRRQAA